MADDERVPHPAVGFSGGGEVTTSSPTVSCSAGGTPRGLQRRLLRLLRGVWSQRRKDDRQAHSRKKWTFIGIRYSLGTAHHDPAFSREVFSSDHPVRPLGSHGAPGACQDDRVTLFSSPVPPCGHKLTRRTHDQPSGRRTEPAVRGRLLPGQRLVSGGLGVLLNDGALGTWRDHNLGWKSRPNFSQEERQESGRESGLMSARYEIKTLWVLLNRQATRVRVLSASRLRILHPA